MQAPPPPYVSLNGGQTSGSRPPPPYHRQVPRYNSYYQKPKSGGVKSCFRCICCCYSCLFIIVIVLSFLAFYFYTIEHPKVPSYNVQDFEVKAFDLTPDFSLKTEFLVTVKAENPNNNIGIIYGHSSSVGVYYSNSDLCRGKLPSFHQGQKNTSYIKIDLMGESPFGSGLQEALSESQKNKKIPLLVKVRAPISIVVGEFPLRQFTVFVNVSMVVDNLAPNKKINILSSNTAYDYEF
ncbi:late embryogenesis abundant protein [Striga asiatica]|uniref:Late embryogenesis abundant protein n=1 Tax=Striga asiatica TaxID=4170 RepID=A0A5A7R688_STRAF|nr:late embryogenesis abundant protein [Striga asiatica]